MEKTKDRISSYLENFAGDILTELGCLRFWGEIEVPECLMQEIETDKADQ